MQTTLVWSLLGLALTVLGPIAAARAAVPERAKLSPMRSTDGRAVELNATKGGAAALIFYSSECPISNAYSPTLNRIAEEFPAKSLRLVGVCTDPDLSAAEVATHAKDFGLKFPVVHDKNITLAAQLGATVTPEAFVLDDQGRIRYHGRIDDQFAARQKRNANSQTRELHDAIAAVLEGRAVVPAEVPAVGCPIARPSKTSSAPTYSSAVAAILQKNCLECHRRGQVGPFPLETFAQASKRAGDIAAVTEDRRMPPWKAAPQEMPRFKHNRSLSVGDIATLAAWAEGGAPEGDPNRVPAPPVFADDWALGTPDLVIELPGDFDVPASGKDVYRCFVIPTHLGADRYVSAIEYQPGNRRVVHHLLGYVDTTGQARKRDDADPGLGYSCFSGPGIEIHGDLGGWAPGNEPSRLPAGVGRYLPANADVVVQVHYHPSGKPETDRSRIGLHFSKSPIKQTMQWSLAGKFDLKIPPGDSNYEANAQWRIPVDVEALAVTPHMHMIGRDMHMWVTFPDGRDQDLIRIPDWDFGWQNTYYFEQPLTLPEGTVLKLVAHFDNSENNPRNPNKPPKLVKFGEGTTDEMCIGFIALTKKGQDLTRPGEKDDLRQIIEKDLDGLRKKYRDKRQSDRAKEAGTESQ
jgi:peroxiredoxin/mono/diheme cytochrome c family protein